MAVFAIVTGIVTLLAFIIQILDLFPEHKETRIKVAIFSLGMFIGIVIGGIKSISISFEGTQNPTNLGFFIVLFLFCLVIAIVVIAASMSGEKEKRDKLFGIAGGFTFAFSLMFIILLFVMNVSLPIAERDVTLDEILLLSNNNAESKNYDRAIMYLEKSKSRIQRSDPRYKSINERIDIIKKKQLGE